MWCGLVMGELFEEISEHLDTLKGRHGAYLGGEKDVLPGAFSHHRWREDALKKKELFKRFAFKKVFFQDKNKDTQKDSFGDVA